MIYALQGDPAHIVLFTGEDYSSKHDAFYKETAAAIMKDELKKYGITFDERSITIRARSWLGKVEIDIYSDNAGVDCEELPAFVKDMIKRSFLVTGANVRCGSDPNVIYVGKNHP
ncbi:hypothetical protein Y032_0008g96 [Ancylostoma ceylanicum]|uniref:Uncharacterized protein n=1 Tax=Ancylostoma ceylanicum TaxID=53326 RepID=A0A016VLM7_9BILA|nr:hypothetical protein Y032_0008g96 [Ancylostoma ceylanicum]